MTDDELLERTLEWVAGGLEGYIEEKGWESPRQLWEHMLTCNYCSVGIGDDCGPYVEENPERPLYNRPPVPREMWSSLEKLVFEAYAPAIKEAVRHELYFDKVTMTGGSVKVTRELLGDAGHD